MRRVHEKPSKHSQYEKYECCLKKCRLVLFQGTSEAFLEGAFFLNRWIEKCCCPALQLESHVMIVQNLRFEEGKVLWRFTIPIRFYTKVQFHKLSAMDVLARTTMKDAANCDTQCELQNSVNHWTAERKRRHRDFLLMARLFQCFWIVNILGFVGSAHTDNTRPKLISNEGIPRVVLMLLI